MNLKTMSVLTMGLILLNACATLDKALRPQQWARTVQDQESRENHEALAKHYDEIARQMLADAEDSKQKADYHRQLAAEIK
jgi:hypothetical protein